MRGQWRISLGERQKIEVANHYGEKFEVYLLKYVMWEKIQTETKRIVILTLLVGTTKHIVIKHVKIMVYLKITYLYGVM